MNFFILIHVFTALLALSVSFWIIFQTKGTHRHRFLGWCFVISLFISALSSFWIPSFGQFSFIHLLSIAVIYWLCRGILAVRAKKPMWRYRHATEMGAAYIAILIAGVGVLVRHFIVPGNVLLGGIASGLFACIAIPVLAKTVSRYQSK